MNDVARLVLEAWEKLGPKIMADPHELARRLAGRYSGPLVTSWNALDPSLGRHCSRPDPLWGSLWEFLPDQIPDDFEQTILRRPHFKYMKPGGSGTLARHPIYKDDLQFRGWRWVFPGCKKDVRTGDHPFATQKL